MRADKLIKAVLSYKKLSIAVILGFSLFAITYTVLHSPFRVGETDTNVLGLVSIFNSGSFSVSEDDFIKAKEYFPEYYSTVNFDAVSLFRSNLKSYLWYFPTYSISSIPVFSILKLLDVPLHKAFKITNALLYILALCVIFFKLKVLAREKFYIILLVACSPTLLYLRWTSSEICIFTFVTLSAVFFYNKEYKKSALFIAIAGTMNPTVSAFGFLIIIKYFYDIYLKGREQGYVKTFRTNLLETVKLAVCFLPAFIPFIYSRFATGTLYQAGAAGDFAALLKDEYIFPRFFTYLFDLNIGFLHFFPILTALFFIILVISITKRDFIAIVTVFGAKDIRESK